MNEVLKHYLKQGLIWRASQGLEQGLEQSAPTYGNSENQSARSESELEPDQPITTGYEPLDAALRDQGWPVAALVELLSAPTAISELRLLLPIYQKLSQRFDVAFINPPYVFNGTALQQQGVNLEHTLIIQTQSKIDTLWALQQCLLSNTFAMVVGWLPEAVSMTQIKKLRVACDQGSARCFLYRPHKAAHNASAANLRLVLQSVESDRVVMTVIKQKGSVAWQELSFSLKPSVSINRAIPTYRWPLLQTKKHSTTQAASTPNNSGKGHRLNRLN